MPLAYYSRTADAEFWSEHWTGQIVDDLLATAKVSPLTGLIEAALPPGDRILEAGCGLGQYVMLLRERGRRVVGVDRAFDALSRCRKRAPGTPLAVMDLRALGFRSGVFAAYLSLGVVEHDPNGPDMILREARRLLEPGGILILSVPYVNGVRRLGAWWIRRRSQHIRQSGGEFYQFAFTRGEVKAFMERNGFRVLSACPYDPARLLRSWARRLWRRRTGQQPSRQRVAGPEAGADGPSGHGSMVSLARRLLYTGPSLNLLGHMILFVGARTD